MAILALKATVAAGSSMRVIDRTHAGRVFGGALVCAAHSYGKLPRGPVYMDANPVLAVLHDMGVSRFPPGK